MRLLFEKIADYILCLYIITMMMFSNLDNFNIIFKMITLCMIAIMFLIFIRKGIHFNYYINCFLLFLCYMTIHMIVSSHLEDELTRLLTLLQIWIVSFFITNFITNREKVYRLLNSMIIGYIGCILFLIIKNGIKYTFSYRFRLGEETIGANGIGFYSAIIAIIAFSYIVYCSKHKNLYIITFIISIVFGCLSGSKKFIIILIIGIVCILANYKKFSFKTILLISIFLLFLYFAITNLDIFQIMKIRLESYISSVLGFQTKNFSDSIRSNMIEIGLQLFIENPIFGYGFNKSINVLGTYLHNNYIELLVSSGVVGTTLYYSIYVYLIRRMYKLRGTHLGIIQFSFIVSIVVSEYGMVTYYDKFQHLLFAIMSSYITIASSGKGVLNENH